MGNFPWEEILKKAEEIRGDVQIIFHTDKGPSALEKEWKEHMKECSLSTIKNIWFPYAPYGLIEVECRDFNLFGTWILSDNEKLISIKRMDGSAKAMLRSLGSNNIESGVLRLFSYEMIPEG